MDMLILFLFGAVIGSFLNVVGLRWNSGLSLGGRSSCATCSQTLRWWELVPIVSFLTLRGRCWRCRSKISRQYPIVELWTGLIFVTVPIILLPVFCIYVVITIYDLRHKIIPDNLVYASIVLSLLVPLLFQRYSTIDWLAGPILFAFFGSIWLLSRGRAMGFGDAKLGLSIGLLLGAAWGFSAIILAFWIGAAFGIIYMLLSHVRPLLSGVKKITIKSEIPFAPFMVVGAWLSVVYNLDLLHVSMF